MLAPFGKSLLVALHHRLSVCVVVSRPKIFVVMPVVCDLGWIRIAAEVRTADTAAIRTVGAVDDVVHKCHVRFVVCSS